MAIGLVAVAELLGLLAGWLVFKITSWCYPPIRTILHRIGRAAAILAG
ncbi:hypothetical protein [Planosporangium sp. 12N6]